MHYHTAGDVCYEDLAVKVNSSGTDGKLSYISNGNMNVL